MKSGIAVAFAREFGADKFRLEECKYKGNINKLGCVDFTTQNNLYIVNSYMQYHYHEPAYGYSHPFDYDACRMCLKKIRHMFSPKKIGLPMIGCGLAGGNVDIVLNIIDEELGDEDVTLVLRPNEFHDIERSCIHISCTDCDGWGRKSDGKACQKFIDCPCNDCTPDFYWS